MWLGHTGHSCDILQFTTCIVSTSCRGQTHEFTSKRISLSKVVCLCKSINIMKKLVWIKYRENHMHDRQRELLAAETNIPCAVVTVSPSLYKSYTPTTTTQASLRHGRLIQPNTIMNISGSTIWHKHFRSWLHHLRRFPLWYLGFLIIVVLLTCAEKVSPVFDRNEGYHWVNQNNS